MSQLITSTSFISDLNTTTNLVDTSLKQALIAFPGGYTFNFVDALSGVIDVDVRNYTLFYLTRKSDLSQKRTTTSSTRKIKYLSTTLSNDDVYLVNVISSPLSVNGTANPNVLNLVYNTETTTTKENANIYRIDFIDDELCLVSYTDLYGVSYLTVDNNNECVLKRGYNYSDEEVARDLYLRYVIGNGKISLIKNTCDGPLQLRIYENKLSARAATNLTDSMIQVHALKINGQVEDVITGADDMSYIKYKPNSVVVDAVNSYSNLNNNYLITKNLNTRDYKSVDIITLKNQMSDLNTMVRGNNMVLSSGNTKLEKLEVDMRSYTSINKNIDGHDQHGLELNYSSYNMAYKILPGTNIIKTRESLYPYNQLNIQDTKFINCGGFSSLTPMFADRVIAREENNKSEDYVYLCTWLSGAPLSNDKLWVDRYYYPDLIKKEEAIAGEITFTTYDKYVQNFVSNDANISSNIATDYYFDVKSNMVFKPNNEYIYERIDLNNLSFIQEENILNRQDRSYYNEINKNNGFVFAAKIRSYGVTKNKVIKSSFNKIPAGTVISYNGKEVVVSHTLYNNQTGRLIKEEGRLSVESVVTSNVVVSVDNVRGIIQAYINGINVINTRFPPLKYSAVVYGDFVTDDGGSLFASEKYLVDPFITGKPLPPEFVEVINCKYNSMQQEMTITLPQGRRNNIDSIKELNALQANKKSKTSDIDVYVNDIETNDSNLKEEVAMALRSTVYDVVPMNTNIRNVEVL